MAEPSNLKAMLKQNLELQQQQIATQNKVIEQMQQQSAAREHQYKDLLKRFESVGVNGSQPQSAPPAPKKKARASIGSIPNKMTTPSKSAKPPSSKKVPATPAAKTSIRTPRASAIVNRDLLSNKKNLLSKGPVSE